MQIFFDEPNCFNSMMARYGKFTGVRNYLAIVGKKSPDLQEKAGYYGEKIVLLAQSSGLNSCWVEMTHGKSAAVISKGEKLVFIIVLGYGKTQGIPHNSKSSEAICLPSSIAAVASFGTSNFREKGIPFSQIVVLRNILIAVVIFNPSSLKICSA